MDHQQQHQEAHRIERKEKQAEERQSEKNFSKPGPMIHPLWYLIGGIVLCLIALFIWMKNWMPV